MSKRNEARDQSLLNDFAACELSIKRLAEKYSLSESRIYAILRDNSHDERVAKNSNDMARELRDRHSIAILVERDYKKYSIEQMASLYGTQPRVVRAAVMLLRERGVMLGPYA